VAALLLDGALIMFALPIIGAPNSAIYASKVRVRVRARARVRARV